MHRPTKIVILMLLGALGCAGLTMPHAIAQEEVITLEALAGGGQRLPVAFGHDLHMGLFDCLDCHHDYRDGVNVLEESALEEGNPDLKCGSCHHADASLDRQKAFHRLCLGCHIQVRKAGGARGPEMCGACHRPPS